MNQNQTELKALYTSLKELCDNFSLSDIPMFKDGNKLVPNYKKGKKIHIKKKNRGKFTASAKRAGRSVQEHARAVLNNPNATPLQKKRANFARNAAKWKRQEGGIIDRIKSALQNQSIMQRAKQPIQYNYTNIKNRINPTLQGSYGGGQFGGSGSESKFLYIPQYETIEKKDTLYLPIERTFNQAFAEARRDSLPEFMFNGKRYTTEMGNNPNSNSIGNSRTEVVDILPIEYKKQLRVRKNENSK